MPADLALRKAHINCFKRIKTSLKKQQKNHFELLKEQRIVSFNQKKSNTLIEQTNKEPQETSEFKLNRQRVTFSFFATINLNDEGK